MTTLYSCKSEIDELDRERYRITKFDSDMNVEGSYIVTVGKGWAMTCECPAMGRPTCRHREMLPKFIARGAVNTNLMFDFDRGGWVQMEWEGELNCAEQSALSDSSELEYEEPEGLDEGDSDLEPVELTRAMSPEPLPTPSPSPILRRF